MPDRYLNKYAYRYRTFKQAEQKCCLFTFDDKGWVREGGTAHILTLIYPVPCFACVSPGRKRLLLLHANARTNGRTVTGTATPGHGLLLFLQTTV